MKKVIALGLVILLLLLFSGCSLADNELSALDISDGIQLGMSPKEVSNAAKKANKSLVENEFFETTILEQPYSQVYLSFVDNLSDFSSSFTSHAVVAMMMNDFSYSMVVSAIESGIGFSSSSSKEDAETILVQASVYITADQKYTTAIDTFETIEKYLLNRYGETRYTSRRGESLPVIDGYEKANCAVITQECEVRTGKTTYPVPYYSQRIIKVDDGKYVVIDHHITLNESKSTFTHCVNFTLIPENIE